MRACLSVWCAVVVVPLSTAFVVFYFSGLWPHIKLIATLVLWFRPESERERGKWQGRKGGGGGGGGEEGGGGGA